MICCFDVVDCELERHRRELAVRWQHIYAWIHMNIKSLRIKELLLLFLCVSHNLSFPWASNAPLVSNKILNIGSSISDLASILQACQTRWENVLAVPIQALAVA